MTIHPLAAILGVVAGFLALFFGAATLLAGNPRQVTLIILLAAALVAGTIWATARRSHS